MNGCLRNWHCRQTEKAREVGLTELTVGAVGRNGARTGVDVVRVMCMLDRIDCRNSNGMDCMTESSAWRRKECPGGLLGARMPARKKIISERARATAYQIDRCTLSYTTQLVGNI